MCFPFHGVLLSAFSAASPQILIRVNAEKQRKTALPFWRAADCRPYGKYRKNDAKAVGSYVEKPVLHIY